MKMLRVVVYHKPSRKMEGSGIREILEFHSVTDALGVVNTLRRKPATTAISRALMDGGKVEITGHD